MKAKKIGLNPMMAERVCEPNEGRKLVWFDCNFSPHRLASMDVSNIWSTWCFTELTWTSETPAATHPYISVPSTTKRPAPACCCSEVQMSLCATTTTKLPTRWQHWQGITPSLPSLTLITQTMLVSINHHHLYVPGESCKWLERFAVDHMVIC